MIRYKRLILTVVFIILFFSFVIFLISIDERTPYVNDLILTCEQISNRENAFYYFNKAAEVLNWPKNGDKITWDIINKDEYNKAYIEELLKNNKVTFKYIKRGIKCNKIQITGLKGYETEMPYLTKWRKIGLLMSIESLYQFTSGEENIGLETALNIVKFGHMIESAGGCMITYLVGSAIKEYGLDRIQNILKSTKIKNEKLFEYLNDIDKYLPSDEGAVNVLKTEFMFISKTIDKIKKPTTKGKMNIKTTGHEDLDNLLTYTRIPFFFKPNKTKRMFAEYFRVYINNIHKYYKDIQHPEIYPLNVRYKSKFELLLAGNPAGEVIYRMLLPSLGRFFQRKCYEYFLVQGVKVLMALKCYKDKHGDLPETLDEIVPRYLSQIPSDPFNSENIKYSKVKRVVYSVGSDLQDEGGNTDGKKWDIAEPTLLIELN